MSQDEPPHLFDRFDLPEGPIEIRYPVGIKRGSVEDVGDFLAQVLTKMKRISRQAEAKPKRPEKR